MNGAPAILGLPPGGIDLLALALTAASAAWGLVRGLWSQVLALALLVLAFALAPTLSPLVEPPLRQVLGGPEASAPAAAWGGAFAGVLLVGGVLLRALGGVGGGLPKGSRLGGSLLGALKGALLAFVASYGLVLAAPADDLARAARGSRLLPQLPAVRARLAPVLRLPSALAQRLAEADAALRPGAS